MLKAGSNTVLSIAYAQDIEQRLLGYEPADLTVHSTTPPPPPQNCRG